MISIYEFLFIWIYVAGAGAKFIATDKLVRVIYGNQINEFALKLTCFVTCFFWFISDTKYIVSSILLKLNSKK